VVAEVDKWGNRAELAVREDDDDLARTGLEKQVAAEKKVEAATLALQAAQQAADRARQAREDLQEKMSTLEAKKDEILARAQAAKQQEEVQKVLAGIDSGSGDSILAAVARMEEKVAEAEARADAYTKVAAGVSGENTEAKFRELERKQSIDERLAELKAKLGSQPESNT